ncbi:hypothetical protein CHD15_26045 (plasmid) [Salmonella enterica]|nr:hypothetical protein CHD15_26045 [Salmonella enterica]
MLSGVQISLIPESKISHPKFRNALQNNGHMNARKIVGQLLNLIRAEIPALCLNWSRITINVQSGNRKKMPPLPYLQSGEWDLLVGEN